MGCSKEEVPAVLPPGEGAAGGEAERAEEEYHDARQDEVGEGASEEERINDLAARLIAFYQERNPAGIA
eukprot:CAMPEP_0169446628 /NCGR_PEP_ID=MMETSP1042-20121227/11078_1 /TAXON_ID=464988 /ORGANISM="Hemiselmis andersenii, Strain CCMP1180" /LENGTH=68 /DNA_ID=CAMNT_0009558111 /DNA_START=295 /DNA_END=498 /DNA_ORIENTATION=-